MQTMEHVPGRVRDAACMQPHRDALPILLAFSGQFCQLVGLDLARPCRQLVLVTVTVTIITVKEWAVGDRCGLLSTNADDDF